MLPALSRKDFLDAIPLTVRSASGVSSPCPVAVLSRFGERCRTIPHNALRRPFRMAIFGAGLANTAASLRPAPLITGSGPCVQVLHVDGG